MVERKIGQKWGIFMFKILVVEDDVKIREIILENLEKWGYTGLVVDDFTQVFQSFMEYQPHLVLLDINLPTFDGFYWCGKIREVSKVPILFISSRNTNMDLIMAINLGGDDFIQKPFSLEVLMAKINALIRRVYSYVTIDMDIIEHQGVILNLKDNELIYQDGKIYLSRNEFKILHILMRHCGQIVSRDKLMENLWKDESFVDDNTLTVNINRLRKKLADSGLDDLIKTKRGQGYIIQ